MSQSQIRREHRVSTGDSGYAPSMFRTSRQNTGTQASSRNTVRNEFSKYELSSSDLDAWLRRLFPGEGEDFKIQVRLRHVCH